MEDFQNMNETDEILFWQTASNFGFVGAIICSIFGTIVNLILIWYTLKNMYNRDWDDSLNCLMLIKAICQLMLSAGCLPIVALGYYYREDFFENVLSPRSCEKFGFFFFMNYAALNWIHCMMSFNRFMVFQCKIGKSD